MRGFSKPALMFIYPPSHLNALIMSDWRTRPTVSAAQKDTGNVSAARTAPQATLCNFKACCTNTQLGENYKLHVPQSRFVNYVTSYKMRGHT